MFFFIADCSDSMLAMQIIGIVCVRRIGCCKSKINDKLSCDKLSWGMHIPVDISMCIETFEVLPLPGRKKKQTPCTAIGAVLTFTASF